MILTRQERQIVLFLILTTLVGLGINFLGKYYSQIRVIGYVNQDAGKISLNQADKQALINVPGIGAKLAQRIIDYREKNRRFNSIEELNNVRGIGKSKYEAMRGYFSLD